MKLPLWRRRMRLHVTNTRCRDGIVSLAAMRYYDDYQRDDGVWRFKKRVISFLYYVPVTEYKTVLGERNRVSIGGERMPADYPESLPAWQTFHDTHVATDA